MSLRAHARRLIERCGGQLTEAGRPASARSRSIVCSGSRSLATSRPQASLYGFSSHSRVRRALVRLQGRGLVDERDGNWYIIDPRFNEWPRRSSPLADRPVIVAKCLSGDLLAT